MYICENCGKEHNGSYGSGRFCSTKCSRGFSTKYKRAEINEATSKTLKARIRTKEIAVFKYVCEKCGSDFDSLRKLRDERKKHCTNCKRISPHAQITDDLRSILELSKRTISKILVRAKRKCERCGWNESSLDIHHINGKKIENANSLTNLVILCPNCHRLAHTNKIKKEELQELSMYKTFLDWIQYYHPSN